MEYVTSLILENLFGVVSWAIRIGALLVIPFRRTAAEARTWLMGFFIAPLPALFLYLVLGSPRHAKKRRALFAKLPDVLDRVVASSGLSERVIEAPVKGRNVGIANLAKGIAELPPLGGNSVEMLTDYDGSIDRLIADIEMAQHHVHLEYYTFAADKTGRKVVAALERAEERGVQCRVLIDAMGSFGFGGKTEKRLKKAGCEVHRILPLRRRWNASRIDLRNHRKIAVIDGRIGYTGSQNIVDAEVSDGFSNRELAMRLQGPIVAALQSVFIGDWYLETREELDEPYAFDVDFDAGDMVMQALPSGPDYEGGRVDMVFTQMIHSAQKEIVLVTPYFIPNQALVQALRTAVLRGVKVTLVLSVKLDSKIVEKAQRSYYAELLAAGVVIKLFAPHFLHAKHLRIDRRICLIGSSNMDMRSFELNAEISVLAYGEAATGKLAEAEQEFMENTEELVLSEWKDRNLITRAIENTARLASDLL